MSYSSLTSILIILPGMPQTNTSAGYSVASAAINKHIDRADNLINGKIAKRYSVPITPTPPILNVISQDLTTYFSYRSFYNQDNHNKMEDLETLAKTAMEMLDEIRDGKIDLVDSSGSEIAEKTTDSNMIVDSNSIDYQPFFDVDEPTSWKFDSDLLDEVEGNR